ncbi:MAG: hypothetical protein GY928_27820 [Colwellia sp.]|nr:hypothetical protein [Colwellia sp.]
MALIEKKIKELEVEFGELDGQLQSLKQKEQQITIRLIEIRGALKTLKDIEQNGK